MKVEDRTVEYKYDTLWSLIHFLRRHGCSPADFDQLADSKPHTLKFVIETRRKGAEGQDDERSQTKVFIRVTPAAPDEKKREILVMPSFFSEMAPQLNLKSMNRKRTSEEDSRNHLWG